MTTPTRTLYDLARIVRPRDLARALSEAQGSRLATQDEVRAMAQRYMGRPGGRRLAELVGEGIPTFTRSEAEARLLRLVERAGLPRPRVNHVLEGYEVDFHWPDARLVVEVDGFAFHASRRSFERDRIRDADLSRAGWRVVRVTWRQLSLEPLALAARLGGLLAQRGDR